MKKDLRYTQKKVLNELSLKKFWNQQKMEELIKYIPEDKLKQWYSKYCDDDETDDETDDEEEKIIPFDNWNNINNMFYCLLHSNGNTDKLTSTDFVKEMTLIIKSRSIDWKDVKYNYLDYSQDYLSKN